MSESKGWVRPVLPDEEAPLINASQRMRALSVRPLLPASGALTTSVGGAEGAAWVHWCRRMHIKSLRLHFRQPQARPPRFCPKANERCSQTGAHGCTSRRSTPRPSRLFAAAMMLLAMAVRCSRDARRAREAAQSERCASRNLETVAAGARDRCCSGEV